MVPWALRFQLDRRLVLVKPSLHGLGLPAKGYAHISSAKHAMVDSGKVHVLVRQEMELVRRDRRVEHLPLQGRCHSPVLICDPQGPRHEVEIGGVGALAAEEKDPLGRVGHDGHDGQCAFFCEAAKNLAAAMTGTFLGRRRPEYLEIG
eukprot:5637250-Pleurochrysis_carterae.AAC.4